MVRSDQRCPLSKAIEQAAVAVAKDDRRFPPISPVELPYLDMDVWLLGKLEPVLAQGCQRRNAVIIGKHGLKIAKGGRSGLLLPGVAVEHHLDAEGFLEQVCHKAGLPADAWQDDDATLMTFQGHAIEGELNTLLLPLACRTRHDHAAHGARRGQHSLPSPSGEGQGVRA